MAGRGWRGRFRRGAGRNHDLDMDAIRNLAREAPAYQDLQAGSSEAAHNRPGLLGGERPPWDWADADPVIFHEAGVRDSHAAPWRHQWSPFEADVTPWLSPEEREAAAQPSVVNDEDRAHPNFIEAVEEDRVDALEASREDGWAARERVAEALDRLAGPNGGEADEHLHADIENDPAIELE